VLVAGCSGGSDPDQAGLPGEGQPTGQGSTTFEAIASPVDLATVELISPDLRGAGPAPTFEWGPVTEAAAYRLTVLGPDGPRWAWEGVETSVRYGGVVDGQAGPALVPGSWWSVSALDEAGLPIALSELRPVSPTDDPGPAPDWEMDDEVAVDETPAPAPEPATDELTACDVLSPADVDTVLGGVWESIESMYPAGKGSVCTFNVVGDPDTMFDMSLSPAAAYTMEGWGGEPSELLAGVGDEAYLSPLVGSYIGVLNGENSLFFAFGMAPDPEAFVELARIADSRLP
jgi:hypothetical protein